VIGEKRNEAEYVLGVVDNVVRAVYYPPKWRKEEVPPEAFIPVDGEPRYGVRRWAFEGDEVADEAVKQRYLNRRIPTEFTGQPPVRYTW
jgi:hypothetical protein